MEIQTQEQRGRRHQDEVPGMPVPREFPLLSAPRREGRRAYERCEREEKGFRRHDVHLALRETGDS